MVLPAQDALTPEGNPVAAPMPVAPVVVWLMFVITVLTHKIGVEDGGLTVLIWVARRVGEECRSRWSPYN